MADWIQPGQQAPDFTLPTDNGDPITLSALRGQAVVLYFYPRDDTPGCTAEACAFRDQKAQLTARGAVVLGISTDTLASHLAFREKFHLNFPLLADTNHRVSEAYGAWREKVRAGKKSMGMQRSTFLIDRQGVVRQVWTNVKVEGHDQEVLKALAEMPQLQ
jgi:peroxiredoxin Q/BCP